MAVFIPDEFILEQKMSMQDYHFVILHSTPPPVTISNNKIQCKKGSLICMKPDMDITVHSIEKKSKAKYMSVCINKEFFDKIALESMGIKNVRFKSICNIFSRQLLDFLEYLILEILNYGEQNQLMVACLEIQIIIQILRDSDLDLVMHNNQRKEKDYVEQAIEYIEKYYSSNITINELCKAIYVSPSYFQRIFKGQMSITPYQYIMEFRHKMSKIILREQNLSIEDVARLCGFVRGGHFSTEFKRREGISPLEYKKKR